MMKNVKKRFQFCVIFIVIVNFGYTSQNPLKDPRVCGRPQCRVNEKFKYGPGTQQDYKYTVEVRSLFNGTSKNESTLYVEGMVNLAFLTPCDGILTLSDIKLSEYIPRDDYESSDHANSKQFFSDITENSLRFSFNDGIISELCPSDDEKSWVLNFKRGILSMLQNSMRRFDVDHSTDEEDVRGKCFTKYAVIGAKETSLVIEKTKDLNSCQTRGKLHSAVQSVPYNSQPGINEYNIMRSTSECKLSIDHNIYSNVECKETHIFRPLSNKQAGATSVIVQNLTLIEESDGPNFEDQEQPDISKRTTLHFDHTLTEKVTNAKLKESRDLIKKLCQQNPDDIQFQMSDLFSKFIRTSRGLSFPALKSLYGHAGRICRTGLKIFLHGLPYIGTSASVGIMKEILSKSGVPESVMNEWVISIAFTSSPDEDMMELSALLLEEQTFSPNIALSIASLSHTYCQRFPDCGNNDAVSSIVQYFENKIRIFYVNYKDSDRKGQENLIVSLKALSNIGVITKGFHFDLYRIIEDTKFNLETRLAAIGTFRRLPCEEHRTYFEEMFANQDEDVEIRIASYLQLMKCPSYLNIRTIRQCLLIEEVNQVGSFVWTHLTNLLQSSIPSRVEIQSILSEKDLVKKFDTDIRKYSHNREGSIYFDEWRAGGSYENNIIFSPSSFIPRTAMLNMTIDLFGESVNFLEINARAEGFEQYLESLFGPRGSSKNVTDNLPFPKMRWTRSINDDKALLKDVEEIPNLRKDFNENPKVSLGFKIFGNELKYNTLNGMDEIKKALGKLNPEKHLKEFLSGKNIAYNKAVMFLDSSYVVASGAGLPIALNAVGTSSIDIKLHGSLKGNFLKNRELDVTVNVKPSVSLDISGEMSVNAFYASTGIKLKTNVYTASAFETYVKIRGSQLVSIKCTLPRQNTEIIGARSELLIKQNDIEQAQSGLSRNLVSESICYWPDVDKAVGLKPCGDYHFTNVTKINNAPYFLLAGPAGFRWYLNKSDPSAKIYLFEYKKVQEKNNNVYSLILDTPGSEQKRSLAANLTIDMKTENIAIFIKSSDGALLARGKFRNTENEKILEAVLDINNQKHFETSFSLTKTNITNGYNYRPKLYLGVNGERVIDLQGDIQLLSKNGVSQYSVDVKFSTKRLTSKLNGYITITDYSISTLLHLYYKFQNTKEHLVKLEFVLSNKSRRNMLYLRGMCNLNSTAYPNFNFDSNLTFYRTENHIDLNITLDQNPLTENHVDAARKTLKFKLSFSDKFIDNKRTLNTEVTVKRPSSNLNLKGQLYYERHAEDINCAVSVRSNNKEVAVTLLWSHPRTTLEQIKTHLNVTIPSFKPMILEVEVKETQPKDYMLNINGTWFSGHNLNIAGSYHDRSGLASNHILKLYITSPNFDRNFTLDLEYFKNDTKLLVDVNVEEINIQGIKNQYVLYVDHIVLTNEYKTNAGIKYKKKVYTMNSTIYDGEYRKAEVELKIDQLRDIHFLASVYNHATFKAIEFDIKWDANRDPTQKLLFTANFTQISAHNQVSELVISYPGRTIVGKYKFLLEILERKLNKIDVLTSISWDDDKSLGFDFLLTMQTKKGINVDLNMNILTPFESWRIMRINGKFDHLNNMYLLKGGVTWDHRQKVHIGFYGDRLSTPDSLKYDYKFSVNSTLRSIPSIATTIIHYQNSSSFNSNLHFMYNPELEIYVDSKWKIIKDNSNTNLTGNVFLKTPFKGINTGVLISKIFLTDKKYIRGIADLDLDNKKVLVTLEGRFKKLTNSMIILNVTTEEEEYQGRFILSEENRHLVAQVIYPNGSLGTEILFSVHSFSNFDIKFTLGTPIEFMRNFIIVARLQPADVDFRLGWNFLVVGFSGVWHYGNVTDFEYAYKIYTPLEDFEENGVVGKLIFKEGLDFEVSIKLSIYKLGLKLLGKPKPKPLKELGIEVQKIYESQLPQNLNDGKENTDPISWEGLIEINAIIYPTMKGKIEIDQKGRTYHLQAQITLPHGTATLSDEFEYIDVLRMKNNLEILTPYQTFQTVSSTFNVLVIPNNKYLLGVSFDYKNKTELIRTGVFVKYTSDTKEASESRYNATLDIVTPFEALPKLEFCAEYESEENFFKSRLSGNTVRNSMNLDLTAETENEVTEVIGNVQIKTSAIEIPPMNVNVKKHFSELDNSISARINWPQRMKKEIYMKSSWLIKSQTQFRAMLRLESPFSGMKNITGGVDVHIGDYKSNIWTGIYLNPLTVEISSSLIDNDLQINSTLDVNTKRFPIIVVCKFVPTTENTKLLDGTVKLKEKEFKINGTVQFKSKLPVNLLIQLRPLDGTDTLNFQYELQPASNGYELAGTLRRSDKLTKFNVYATGNNKFNWEFILQVKAPSKQQYEVRAKALGTEDSKNVAINLTTPIPKLENPKFGLSLLTNGLKKTVNGFFELPESKGNMNINFIWVFLENMMIKANGYFENKEFEKKSQLEAFYTNPKKEFKYLQVGADVNIDQLWEGGSNITFNLPSNQNIALDAHIKLPNIQKDVHSISGNLTYGQKFKNLYYYAKYRTSKTNRKYGTLGEVNVANDEDLKGTLEVEWAGKTFSNFANLKRPKGTVDLIYKLKTPKYTNQHLFVGLINFKTLTDRYNISGEAFYPEKISVAFGTVNYKELGNMNGMFNVSVSYKKLNYTGAYFKTLTDDYAYNRYVKVFWNNESATFDGICNIAKGREKSESITKGKLNITIPLNTRHNIDVDFKYNKKEKLSVGEAKVNYNSEEVLVGKYNCLAEKRENFNKKTIHVELENNKVPVGADYVHGTEYSKAGKAGKAGTATRDRFNAPTVVDDYKYLHLYHLKNASKFNVTGVVNVSTSPTGQNYVVAATHLNRTVKLWMDYDVLSKQYKQHSRLELSPTVWIEYDLDLLNRTVVIKCGGRDETFDAQQIQINISYPRRNFTAQSFYNISDSIVSTDVSLVWDKDNKRVQAGLDWMRASPLRDQIQLLLKHPSFQRDVSFFTEYGHNKTSADISLLVNYSDNPDQTLTMKGSLNDNSNSLATNYTYILEAQHVATSLSLKCLGDLYWNKQGYGTEHITYYKRSYLPLSIAETFGKVNLIENSIELKNQNNVAGLSYLWGRYGGNFPVYTASISATHGINDTSGEFFLNVTKKSLYLDLNMTKDGTQSLHVKGEIPDARSALFDIWRDYEDIRVSDISYYLRLNHSRLITSSLLWRKDVVSEVQNGIRNTVGLFYNDSLKAINETQQYVIAESMEAMHDIWLDAKPLVYEFINDLRNLTVIGEDFEEFKKFLNTSYHKNEFYIRDIATVVNTLFDGLSLKSHLSSLPKIVQEIWEVMGSSAEKINKAVQWALEKLKTYYANTADFIRKLVYGDPIQQLTDVLKHLVEKYDDFIKSIHVAVIQHMERLWTQTYSLIVDNWHKALAALEPTFLKIVHYLETIVWNTSKDFLDFLYIRKSEIIGNPYFAMFSNFTQDVDKFYRDITGNNTISSIYKYTKIAWNFLKEKYLNNVPFAKEVQDIINEIMSEIAELQNIPSIKYFINQWVQSYEFIKYYYDYFIVESDFHKVLTTIYIKLTDKTPTALEMDNRLRTAKTKFIFEPNEGVMLLESKLPMSWHAFNETPRFQEIPEIKSIYELKDYFTASQTSFWNLYNKYRQFTDPSDWLPPFKGQAMLIGNKYYVTFDRKYYDFQGSCTYLLATDFRDGNFTLLASYDVTGNTNEFILIANKTVVRINVFDDTVKIGNSGVANHLPADIGHAYVYRYTDIVTIDSPLGFRVKCNMKFRICSLELSGWYSGKTAGLMGTLNNEPSDDFLKSNNKKSKANSIQEFANSWSINHNCGGKKSIKAPVKPSPAIVALCNEFFTGQESDLTNCFSKVSTQPFMNMCLNSKTEQEACGSAVSYITLCEYEDVPLRIPDTCVKCKAHNGTDVPEGETIRLESDEIPQSADVVFIIEAKACNNNLKKIKNIDILLDSLNRELNEKKLTDNRYAVVVFGGKGVYEEPRSVVINGATFTNHKFIGKYFENIPVGYGNSDVFEALIFAKTLIFRPGVSKTFILIPCSKCDENKMVYDYSTVQYQLVESSISLHILMHAEFSQHKDKDNKVIGLDKQTAYTKKDIGNLDGDKTLRRAVSMPKSALGSCLPLAFENEGSVFSSKYLVSDKRTAKKLSTVFAKRIARSVMPKSCLDCECTASNSGVSYMECYSCRG